MIADSVSFLKKQGRTVFYDAEHFFDGFKANAEYALQSVKVAAEAGADCLVLCDTNGGVLTAEIADIVSLVGREVKTSLGIHCHSDADMAVANTLAAVMAGATQVQGTVNGYGERCGNANLLSIIANLKVKMGIPCVTDEQLAGLTEAGAVTVAGRGPGALLGAAVHLGYGPRRRNHRRGNIIARFVQVPRWVNRVLAYRSSDGTYLAVGWNGELTAHSCDELGMNVQWYGRICLPRPIPQCGESCARRYE